MCSMRTLKTMSCAKFWFTRFAEMEDQERPVPFDEPTVTEPASQNTKGRRFRAGPN